MTDRVPARSAGDMVQFTSDVLTTVGMPQGQAATTARHLIWADVRGTETHGLTRLGLYVDRIRRDDLAVGVAPEVVHEHGATRVVDGHHGMGHVNGDFAMREALRAAEDHGLGAVTVKRSGHFGAAGAYANIAAQAGAIGIATTNAAPLMAPTGGKERRLGTNPIAIAVPHDDFPIIVDIAMSATAAWSIKFAAERGDVIPDQWGLDAEGVPTTDPDQVLAGGGFIRPMGDHKGYGLALMVDILTGVLSGGGYADHIRRLDQDGYVNASHLLMAIPVGSFGPVPGFAARLAEVVTGLHETPTNAQTAEVILPGEREARIQRQRETEGIPYPRGIWADAGKLAADLGIPLPEPSANPARAEGSATV